MGCSHRGREEQKGQGTRRVGEKRVGRSVLARGWMCASAKTPPEGLERGTCDHLFVPREDTQGPRSHVAAPSALPTPRSHPTPIPTPTPAPPQSAASQ